MRLLDNDASALFFENKKRSTLKRSKAKELKTESLKKIYSALGDLENYSLTEEAQEEPTSVIPQ